MEGRRGSSHPSRLADAAGVSASTMTHPPGPDGRSRPRRPQHRPRQPHPHGRLAHTRPAGSCSGRPSSRPSARRPVSSPRSPMTSAPSSPACSRRRWPPPTTRTPDGDRDRTARPGRPARRRGRAPVRRPVRPSPACRAVRTWTRWTSRSSASRSTAVSVTVRAPGSARRTSGRARACCVRSTPNCRSRRSGRSRSSTPGDIVANPFDIATAITQIESAANELIADAKLLTLGGDHTIALPLLRAMAAKHGPVARAALRRPPRHVGHLLR